jgi:hypothetical protein
VTLEQLLREYADVFERERPQSWWNNTLTPDYDAREAREIIRSTHYFDTWAEYEAFIREMHTPGSRVARFEAAGRQSSAATLSARTLKSRIPNPNSQLDPKSRIPT